MQQSDSEYEAPRIEVIISNEEMEREVHYAGAVISGPFG